MEPLDELRFLASRGPDERRQYLDALEQQYGEELKAGNAHARQRLLELTKSHGGRPGTPLAAEFFARLLPLLPKGDQELFLKEMLLDARRITYTRLSENWGWWRRLWHRF